MKPRLCAVDQLWREECARRNQESERITAKYFLGCTLITMALFALMDCLPR